MRRPEHRIGDEQRAHRSRAAQQARIEDAHRRQDVAGVSPGSRRESIQPQPGQANTRSSMPSSIVPGGDVIVVVCHRLDEFVGLVVHLGAALRARHRRTSQLGSPIVTFSRP